MLVRTVGRTGTCKNLPSLLLPPVRFAHHKVKFETIPLENRQRIANALGVDILAAEEVLRVRPTVARVKTEKLERNVQILKKYGFPDGRFLRFTKLLTQTPVSLESYILICKETQINYFDVPVLLQFPSLKKMNVAVLRQMGIIPNSTDVVARYIAAMNIPEIERSAYSSLPKNVEWISLKELRTELLVPYMRYLLDIDEESARGLTKKCVKLHTRPFSWIRQNCEISKEKLNFTNEKVLNNPLLLVHDPSHLLEIVDKVKFLAGRSLQEMAKQRTKILQNSAESLLKIGSILAKYGVEESNISCYPEVYTLSPDTVEERLHELYSDPDLIPFRRNPRVGRLLYLFKRLKKRLVVVQSLGIPGGGPSLNLITETEPKFLRYVNNHVKWKGDDIFNFLIGNYFPDKTEKEVRAQLIKHPHWLEVPLRNMHEVMDLLLNKMKLRKETIFDALPIVLYSPTTVESAIDVVIAGGHADPSDSYFLHMVLYFMEKEHHFKGDGIWTEDSKPLADYHADFEREMAQGIENPDHEEEDDDEEGEEDIEDYEVDDLQDLPPKLVLDCKDYTKSPRKSS